jgi:aspartyl-tRNA(Asn)/glutamyl-tRNA(Gln) amidotransferase subunit A
VTDATDLAGRIRAGELTAVEALQEHLERAERLNSELNAIVTFFDDAEDRARAAPPGPLHGVPFTIKDTIDTAGVRTTRGSRLFADHVPAEDATAVARLLAAGAVPVGKTNTPEFALWWETSNLVFGRTVNPHDPERTAGGSSGGEAVAIATGMSTLGLGTDLGGSIRLPAHYCGVVGFKPTHGRVPLTGQWPATLLRYFHIGPLARSVRDVELALSVLAGPDGRDPYAVDARAPEPRTEPRIAWSTSGFGPVGAEVVQAVEEAAEAIGAEQVEPAWLEQVDCNELTLAIYGAESGAYLDAVVGDRRGDLHPRMQRRLEVRAATLADFLDAEAQVQELRRGAEEFFSRYDVLLCQTAPVPAHEHDLEELIVDGVPHPPRTTMRATIPFDLTGSPAISVPFAQSSEGLPIGVQLVGRRFDEETLLGVARELEAAR